MSKKASQGSNIPVSKQFSATHYTKAVEDQEFFVADPNQSYAKSASYIKISGAVAAWSGKGKNDKSDFVYLPQQRLAGTPDDIRTILRDYRIHSKEAGHADYTDDTIEDLLENQAISADNYQSTMKAEYKAEMDALKEFQNSAKTERAEMAPNADVMLLMSTHLTGEKGPVISKLYPNGKLVSGVSVVAAKRKVESAEDKLVTKLKKAEAAGKVVDVTNLGKDGKAQFVGVDGTPTSHQPKNHYYIAGIPIQSNDYDNYVLAVRLWQNAYQTPNDDFKANKLPAGYADALQALRDSEGRTGARKAARAPPAPTASRRASPNRSQSPPARRTGARQVASPNKK
jgi:hypothetical protein